MTRIGVAGLAGALLVAVLFVASCSAPAKPGGAGVVFTVVSGVSQGMPATTIDVVDVGMPGLHNLSGYSVRLRRVSLVSVARSVHLRSVTAYRPGGAVGIGHGDLLKYCRNVNEPYPVNDAVTPPHSDSIWNVVVAITFAKPGRYYLGRAKIYYTVNGQRGWQYQNLNTTIDITAARKGAKPAFDGCP